MIDLTVWVLLMLMLFIALFLLDNGPPTKTLVVRSPLRKISDGNC